MLQKKKINTVSKVIQSKTCHRQAASDTMADKAIEYSKTIYSGCGTTSRKSTSQTEISLLIQLLFT